MIRILIKEYFLIFIQKKRINYFIRKCQFFYKEEYHYDMKQRGGKAAFCKITKKSAAGLGSHGALV